MNTRTTRRVLYCGAAIALLAACSDTTVSSPGAGAPVSPPPTTSPPPPASPPASDVSLIPPGGCPSGTEQETLSGSTTVDACVITGEITTDITLTAGGGYALSGPVFVGSDEGAGTTTAAVATLTIEAGATLFGAAGSDYLVVARGSQIIAEGTADAPIVMTSRKDVNGTADFVNDRGEWGGLVINGRAPINACSESSATGGTADCEKSGEGSSGLFGGGNPDDDSGVLNYVRVQFAGFNINDEDQLNGIAFQGVGSGTDVDYIQVHNNEDDGVEFFGGTVNVKHVVLTGNSDDSFDVTDGWTGKAQFILIDQAADAGDRAFELDNNGDTNTLLPRSNPTVANFTVVSNPTSIVNTNGILFREGFAGEFYNGIIAGSPNCLDIDQDETEARIGASDSAGDENLVLQSTLLDCPALGDDDSIDEAGFVDMFSNNVLTESTLQQTYFPGPAEQNVTATTPPASETFFDSVNYIGAFSPSETQADNWAAGWTTQLFPEAEVTCPTGTTTSSSTIDGQTVCQLEGNIQNDLTLVQGPLYELIGPVFVGVDRGPDPASPLPSGNAATLSIEAGVTIFGSTGSDYIVVTRGSRILSNGTAANPVVMTSRKDVEGTADEFTDRGEWGGLVINGRAPINACSEATATGGTADCEKSGEGSSGLFGGGTATDDSGNLFYTRVQYAGFNINDEDQLNGIAFQGVGSGTDVNYIQVHNNEDDGVEFFGGTVNVKHVVLTGNSDDSFDVTDGWTGKAQFIIVEQAADAGDRAFELDNNGDTNTLLPRSNPTVSNFTVLSNATSAVNTNGLLFREGFAGEFYNGVVARSPNCLDIDQDETENRIGASDSAGDEDLVLNSTLLDCPALGDSDSIDEDGFVSMFANNSRTSNSMSGFSFLGKTDIGVVPGDAEAAVTVTDVAAIDSFFDSVDYIGAVKDSSDTWYAGWTFVPSN